MIEVGAWRTRHIDVSAALSGILLLALGVGIAITALIADTYMHRGVEPGSEEQFVIQPTGDALATNVDLRVFLGGELESVAEALTAGSIRYVRQPVSWADIEPEQGVFAWEAYDQIFNEMARRDIGVIVVIVDAPDWSRDSTTLDVADGPPADPSSLGAFVQEFTARYGGAVGYVQVWDQPNVASRWGGAPATAAGFLPYLAAAYNGARAGNPEVRIVTPELAFDTSDNPEGADLDFLRGLYAVGAAPFFDIVGIQLDGGTTSPDDRRISPGRHNLSRAVLARELMVESDDERTPIWATSFGWARSEAISASEQAEFATRAIVRSWVEWPWMGLMFQWSFWAQAGSGAEPYSLLQSDGAATPLYRRLADPELRGRALRAETGFVPMDADSVSYSGAWQDQHLENRTFRTTNEIGGRMTLQFRGTGVIAIMRIGPESANVIVEVDGDVVPGGAGESGEEWDLAWTTTSDIPIELVSGLEYGDHEITVRMSQEGGMTLGGLVVEREQPFVWPVVLLAAGSVIALFFGVRSLVMLVGRRSGFLPRPEDEEAWPALPSMPDWRPSRGM